MSQTHPLRDAVVAQCLEMPGAERTHPFGDDTLVLKVGGRMFALVDSTDRHGVTLKADPGRAASLVATYTQVTPGYHLDKRHWISVSLADPLPEGLLADLVEESYELVVGGLPRRLRPVPPVR